MSNDFLDSFDPSDPKDRALLAKVHADRFADDPDECEGEDYADYEDDDLLSEYDAAMPNNRADTADILQALIERGLIPD